MLDIIGTNLPQRQRELNKHVNETISKKVNFEKIKSFEETSDVDRLFKIDVASKYKNVDYILETLKCGDSLYISRALKCEWLYEDSLTEFINPDYLHHNVFPSMSNKMKKKMLSAISCHVRNEERALDFYKYCISIKLHNYALKFLIFTSETYKLEYIKERNKIDSNIDLQDFFGNSFNLIEKYLNQLNSQWISPRDEIIQFCYLYSVSNEKYLNLFETYTHQECYNERKLGLRLSKQILTKHKERVLSNPALYMRNLNMKTVVKYSSAEDAKQYAIKLLPSSVSCFWSMNFYETYKNILNILPANEIYKFLKQIFMDKYNNEFEMNRNFYEQKYYLLLTIEERELWALKNLQQGKELLGSDKDYLWCQFINFDLAFKEIKKYVYKTVDRTERAEIVKILVYSVRNGQELETLFKYYYERYVNEVESNKQDFIKKIIELHNIFKVNDSCWTIVNKIFHSMKCFTEYAGVNTTKAIAIIYYIIHNKAIPANLQINEMYSYDINQYFVPHFSNLTENEIKLIYEYFIKLFCDKIREFDEKEYNDENKDHINNIINSLLDAMACFNKTIHDCPDIVNKYIKLDWDNYKHRYESESSDTPKSLTHGSLIRLLKQDTTVFLKTLPEAIEVVYSGYNSINLNNLMKKLRIYFSNDIAKSCIDIYETFLLQEDISYKRGTAFAVICGIFHIADREYKINFITKYTPTQSKIEHDTIDRKVLMIQEGICRFAYYSRPPVPLPLIVPFIKGDYLSFCLPMLNSYVENLPKQLSIQFISSILDAPVSVQKHGLRLAFGCFNPEDLKKLIVDVWKRTQNVSLRQILYKSLFDYIIKLDDNLQPSFYEVLKSCTLDLNEDDDDEVFNLVRCNMPESLRGDYLETVWKTIEKFSDQKSKNVERKIIVIAHIGEYIHCVNKEFCRIHILDEMLGPTSFSQKVEMYNNIWQNQLIYEKWILAFKYIVNFSNEKEMNRSWELGSIIIKKCIELKADSNLKFKMHRFLVDVLQNILKFSCRITDKMQTLPILEKIIELLVYSMPINEMYLLYWNYNLTILSKKVVGPKKIDETGVENYKHLNTNEIATNFTNELMIFVNYLKEKNVFYPTLITNIADVISDVIDMIIDNTDLEKSTLIMYMCDKLTDIQVPETYLLSLSLLRLTRSRYIDLDMIQNKVIKFGNEEIITFMYQNFL